MQARYQIVAKEKNIWNHISEKGFVSRVYKEHLQLNNENKITQLKRAQDPKRHFFKDTQMAKTTEKMLSLISHQENANQNKILFHTY